MLESFIQQTTKFLKSSNVRIFKPEYRGVIIKEDGSPSVIFTHNEEMYRSSNLEDNLILQIMVFFGVLDATIDTLYPELEGEGFQKRYSLLPQDNDSNTIIAQIYRILILMRNAAVHNKEAVSIQNNIITFKSGIKELSITKIGLELLYSTVLLFIKPTSSNKEYNMGILRRYYDEIKSNISIFKDNNGEGIVEISDGIRLQVVVRYKVENSQYNVDKDLITILNPHNTGSELYGSDYLIKFENRNISLPSEALDNEYKISRDELLIWVE
ncbi:hypothetical protein HNR77_004247 [Paenibacillus sp. JGP012]|uniref:hypothetical protein n=1 Tax=Paenibacillus sp. JGP012 TaxID=2735914 RepID=UPI001617D39E|nr:hypothetical protein [Paenibacillus sp. JGP012]MBB6023147.1 hypothetical protein [Paenibacillus sp. JGP012]